MKLVMLIGFLCVNLVGCSNAGRAPDKPQGPEQPKPTGEEDAGRKGEKNYNTSVGFLLSPQTNLIVDDCLAPTRTPTMLVMDEDLVLDGEVNEWSGIPVLTKDAAGDSKGEIDLTNTAIAFAKGDLSESVAGYVQWRGASNLSTREVFVEFGRYQSGENDAQQWEQNRVFRFDSKGVSEFRFGSWVDASSSAEWKAGVHALEWRIDRRQLDSALLKPFWWTRTYVRAGSAEDDATGVVFLPSVDHDSGQKLSHKWCYSDSNDKVPAIFQFIRTNDTDPDLANKVFNVARLAYDSLQSVLGYKYFPSNQLTVIASSKKFQDHPFMIPDLYDGSAYRPLQVELDKKLVQELRYGSYSKLYEWFLGEYSRQYLAWYGSEEGEAFYLDWLSMMLRTRAEAKVYSVHSRLTSYHQSIEPYLEDYQAVEPIPDLYQRLAGEFDSQAEKNRVQLLANSKVKAAAEVTLFRFDLSLFLESWRLGAGQFQSILQSQTGSVDEVDKVWMGWFDGRPYSAAYSPVWLADPDNDGLPDFMESQLGSNSQMLDTDEDGWSDYAEVFARTNFDDASHRPRNIIADGYFNDWQELLPAEILKPDATLSSKCPAEAGIMAVAALASGSTLIVSLAPKKIDYSGAVKNLSWEIQLQLAYSQRTLILRAEQGFYGFSIIDAKSGEHISWVPTVTKNVAPAGEWVIDFEKYGIDAQLEKNQAVKIKITSILEEKERHLCSSSPWLLPLYHAN